MLVVVVVVDRVHVLAVPVVGVPRVGQELVTAGRPVDMHVAAVRQVDVVSGDPSLIDVIAVGMMEMAVVQEVDVVPMGHLRVPAPAVVQVRVRGVGVVRSFGGGVEGHGTLSWSHDSPIVSQRARTTPC